MRRLLGISMIAVPFIVMGTFIVIVSGWIPAILILGGVAATAGLISLGVYLAVR